jgi:hypothetical protein
VNDIARLLNVGVVEQFASAPARKLRNFKIDLGKKAGEDLGECGEIVVLETVAERGARTEGNRTEGGHVERIVALAEEDGNLAREHAPELLQQNKNRLHRDVLYRRGVIQLGH